MRSEIRFGNMDVPLPDNYEVGTAVGDGDCFFDSLAAGLRQLRADEQFTIQSLRVDCQNYAERHLSEEGSWLRKALENDMENDSIDSYTPRIQYSSFDIGSESANVLDLKVAIWGRPDIEGRILCDIYDVKLHVIEKHLVEGEEKYFDQLVDRSGSKSVDNVDYDANDVVHIVNKGDNHFEPILLKQVHLTTPEESYVRDAKEEDITDGERAPLDAEGELVAQHPEEDFDEGVDSDSSEDERIVDNYKLIETIRSRKDPDEKITKLGKLLDRRADLQFADANDKHNTPLHIAIKRKDVEVIKFLLDNEADVNAVNDDGKSPLDLAEEYRHKRPEILDALRAYLCNESDMDPDPDPESDPESDPEPEPDQKKESVSQNEIRQKVDDACEIGVDQISSEEQEVVGIATSNNADVTSELIPQVEHAGQGESEVTARESEGSKSEGMYDRREGAAGAGGHFLKRNLLTYYKLVADNKLHNFYLAGNMVDAGTFHDVVLRYCNKTERCCAKKEHVWKLLFMQAKHTEIGKGNLSLAKLGLPKCVSSYLEIKQKFNTQSRDPIFTGDFESFDCEFVVYNNATMDESFEKDSAVDKLEEVNSLFHFEQLQRHFELEEVSKVDANATENADVHDGDAPKGQDDYSKKEDITESHITEDAAIDKRIEDCDKSEVDGNNKKDDLSENAEKSGTAVNQVTTDEVGNMGKDKIDYNGGQSGKTRQKAVKFGLGKEGPKDKSAKQDAKRDAKRDMKAKPSGNEGKGAEEEEKPDSVISFKLNLQRSHKEFTSMMEAVRDEYAKLLAAKLAKYISTDKYENMMSDEAIETYHVFLVQNVLTLQGESEQMIPNEQGDLGETKMTRVIRNARFQDNFLEGKLEKQILKFRDNLFEAYATYEMLSKKSRDVVFEDDDDRNSAIDLLVSALGKAKIENEDKTMKTIEKGTMTDEEWQNVCRLIGNVITYIKEQKKFKFAKPEVEYLGRNGQNFMNQLRHKLGIVDKESKELETYTFDVLNEVAVRRLEGTDFKLPLAFGNFKPTLNSSVQSICLELVGSELPPANGKIVKESINDANAYNDIKKLVGNVLVLHESSDTLFRLSDDKLDADLQPIVDTLNAKCLDVPFSFRIDIPKFPRLTLTCPDSIIEKDVEGFLKRLMILTGKPNHSELDVIIKQMMKDCFNIEEKDKEEMYLGISSKIQAWWEEKDEIVYLQKRDNYFQNVVRKRIKCGISKPDPYFLGRDNELDKLKELLQKIPADKSTAASQMVVICGMLGVGKSELVRKFASKCGHLFDDNILWINAESYRSMHESFHQICVDLKIPIANKDDNDAQSLVQAVYQYFPERKTLFVFDNAERYKSEEAEDVGIEKFLPHFLPPNKFTPHFVVTSQNVKWPSEPIRLENFNDEEALTFTKTFLNIPNDLYDDHVKQLTHKFQNHPLALRQAVEYLRKAPGEHADIGQRIRTLCDREDDISSLESDIYTKTVQNTMEISLSTIRNKENGELAEHLLLTMAYFGPDDIPVDSFSQLEMFSNQEALTSAIKLLKQYCLLSGNAGSANIHRVVQQILRLKLRHQDNNQCLRNVLQLFADDPNLKTDHSNHYTVACNHARQNGELVEEFLSVAPS